MTVIYTTAWAQKKTPTIEDWQAWVKSLKSGDKVLFQQFIPRGNFCLDSQVECWRFWDATFLGSRVTYNNDDHPLKDGYAVYWGSDTRWGDVFDARIVPWHGDIAPKEGQRCVDAHAPVFDEDWTEWGIHRHLVLVSGNGSTRSRAIEGIKKQFPRCYARDVYEGELLTVFADWELLKAETVEEIEGARYLYSEPLKRKRSSV